MCMACQMEDELWLAYLDQVARQEKAAAAADPAPAKKAEPASPFVCDEPPSE
jgi:hypothetical protein